MALGITKADLELWRMLEGLAGGDSVLNYVTQVSPRYSRPYHLQAVADALSRARHGPVKICISVPPRFGKTETVLHSLAWRMQLDNAPETEIAYVTYEANLAHSKALKVQEMVQRAGVRLGNKRASHEWFTDRGACMRSTGVGGPLTGNGARLLVIDDPLKNREEAESPVIREKIWDWFTSTAMTRVEPGGSTVIVHTRWHDDDLIGRLEQGMAGDDWEFINVPAILDEGTANQRSLWPERWPLHELLGKRRLVGEYDWASLFMGQPRPKGGRLFQEPARFLHHDPDGCYYVIGCDPAATEKTSSDYSVICVLACKGRPFTLEHRVQVVDLWRGQVQIPRLVDQLLRMAKDWGIPGTGGAPVAIEAVGGFKAVPQMLRELDRRLRIWEINPTTDKFTRAQPCAAAWNDKRVLVPTQGSLPWVDPFVNEVTKFTGVKDPKDDQVDALCHAFNGCGAMAPTIRGVKLPGWREI
jgi:predicted phage terminase large subunit-like protein